MKFAFATFLLITLTAVSSQLTQNWLLDWQSQIGGVTCAPATLNIFSNSSGLFVTYGYSSGTLTGECFQTLQTQSNWTSGLTLNSTGAYVDKMNQSLTYYSNNNTIILYLPPTLPDTPILFTPNGAYISQEEVAGLLAGVWANVTYNQECQTAPPTNISISILQSNGGIESPTAKYYTSSYPYSSTVPINLHIPQINQIIWSISYSGTSNISYVIDPITNQSTLHFQVYNSPSYGACIGTYTRSNNLTSGTWISDWQNGDYQSTYVPSSVQVFNIYNMYMRITFNFASGSSNTGILYSSANGYTDSIYGDTYYYYPSSNTFILNINGNSYLFSTNGSVFNLQPFLGEWSDPQVEDYSDVSDYCCYPRSIRIYNLTDEYDLSSLFIFDGYVANSSGCGYLRNYITHNVYLHMGLTIPSPNGTALTYQNTQYGYSLSFNSSDSTQLLVSYDYENYYTCNFTMMGRAPPRPLSTQLIAKGISAFIFALIVIFI